MADRSVVYRFVGNFTNLTGGLTAAGRSVQNFGQQLTAADKQGQKMRAGLETLGGIGGRVALGAAAGIAAVVVATARFDKAMSAVAATGDEAKASLDQLRQAAIDAGASTAFSATEAAQGIENLLKAGVSVQDVLGGGLAGSLDLAAAGELSVADAAQIASTALTQFKLEGADVPHVADLLAAGAGKAAGDVDDLAQALNQSGLVASQMGLSIEETTGSLSAFASAGLLGSDAGTSLKTLLLSLANPSTESAEAMDRLGISAYDAQGNFVGLADLAGQLQTAFEGKTQAERDSALATIFGSDAIRAASVLYSEGASGITEWTNKVDDAGYASEVAATRLDNLSGDLEALKGAFETALIGSGEGSTGVLRELVQGLTAVVNAYNKLPDAAKTAFTALVAVTGLLGGGLFVTSRVVSAIDNTRTALSNLNLTAGRTSGALKALGVAGAALAGIEVAGLAIQKLRDDAVGAAPAVEGLTGALINFDNAQFAEEFGGSLSDALNNIDLSGLSGTYQDISNFADDFGAVGTALSSGLGSVSGPFFEEINQDTQAATQSLESLDQALAGLVSSGGPERAAEAFDSLVQSQNLSSSEIEQLKSLLPGYADAVAGAANETELAADSQDRFGNEVEGSTDAVNDLAGALGLLEGYLNRRDALRSYGESVTAFSKAIKDGFQEKDAAALDDILSNISAVAQTMKDGSRNQTDFLAGARKSLVDLAQNSGPAAREEIEKAIRKLDEFGVTRPARPRLDVQDGGLQKKVEGARRSIRRLDRSSANPFVDVFLDPYTKKMMRARGDLKRLDKGRARPNVDLNLNPFTAPLGKAERDLGRLNGKRAKPGVMLLGAPQTEGQINGVDSLLSGLDRKKTNPRVTTDVGSALNNIGDVQYRLSQVRDKNVTLTVTTIERTVKRRALGGFDVSSAGDYANAHAPQMAAGGAMRIWAEPETGGESYIPHANDSRRPRAKSILEQTAALFGGQVMWFAGGGMRAPREQLALSRRGSNGGTQTVRHVFEHRVTVTGELDSGRAVTHLRQQMHQVARSEVDAEFSNREIQGVG